VAAGRGCGNVDRRGRQPNHDPLHGRTRHLRCSVEALAADFPGNGCEPRPMRLNGLARITPPATPSATGSRPSTTFSKAASAGCSPSICRRERRSSWPTACRAGMWSSFGNRTTAVAGPILTGAANGIRRHPVDRAGSGPWQPAGGVIGRRVWRCCTTRMAFTAAEVAGQPDDRADQQSGRRDLRDAARGKVRSAL